MSRSSGSVWCQTGCRFFFFLLLIRCLFSHYGCCFAPAHTVHAPASRISCSHQDRDSSVTVVQSVQFFPFCFFKQMLKWKRMLMTFPSFASKSSSLLLLILLTSLTLTCCLWFLFGHPRAGDDSDLPPHHTSVTFLQERSTTNCVKKEAHWESGAEPEAERLAAKRSLAAKKSTVSKQSKQSADLKSLNCCKEGS